MDIGISMEIDSAAVKRMPLVKWVSDSLRDHFMYRDFGSGVQSVSIGFICQKPIAGFESFSKERKPKYQSSVLVRCQDGTTQKISNSFSFDIKVDAASYELFVSGSEELALSFLADLFVNSLSKFESLPKRVKDFDISSFADEFILAVEKIESNRGTSGK